MGDEKRFTGYHNPDELKPVPDAWRAAWTPTGDTAKVDEFRVCARRASSTAKPDRVIVHLPHCSKAPANRGTSGKYTWYVYTVNRVDVARVLEQLGAQPHIEGLSCSACGGWRETR